MALARAAGVFEALGEPARRRILELLADGEQPVGPLVAALQPLTPISQPAVSQHLKVLLDAGLVSVRAAGTRRLYALDTQGLDAARAWLDRLVDPLAPFAQPLDALATEVARGRRAGQGRPSAGEGTGNARACPALARTGDIPLVLVPDLTQLVHRPRGRMRLAVDRQLAVHLPGPAGPVREYCRSQHVLTLDSDKPATARLAGHFRSQPNGADRLSCPPDFLRPRRTGTGIHLPILQIPARRVLGLIAIQATTIRHVRGELLAARPGRRRRDRRAPGRHPRGRTRPDTRAADPGLGTPCSSDPAVTP